MIMKTDEKMKLLWLTGVYFLCLLSLIFVSALLAGCGGPAFEARALEQPAEPTAQGVASDAAETPGHLAVPPYQPSGPNADAGIGGEKAGAAGSRGQDAAPAAGGSFGAGGTSSAGGAPSGAGGALLAAGGALAAGGLSSAGGASAGTGGAQQSCSYEGACLGRQCGDRVACGLSTYSCDCGSCAVQPAGSVQQLLCQQSFPGQGYVLMCPSPFPGSPQGGKGPLPECQELPRYAGIWCCPGA